MKKALTLIVIAAALVVLADKGYCSGRRPEKSKTADLGKDMGEVKLKTGTFDKSAPAPKDSPAVPQPAKAPDSIQKPKVFKPTKRPATGTLSSPSMPQTRQYPRPSGLPSGILPGENIDTSVNGVPTPPPAPEMPYIPSGLREETEKAEKKADIEKK